ncbi:hypothetical protein [Lacisediminimonas profundi]|uniref:hypothetical protein n=1 Tax=Lacisediminimonas profundi TaxID=2603856 RepID=UPI0014077E2E|nr:hypothetical protein [Lacisediminimonas profundi]
MSISKYIPPLDKVSQEVIAVLIATVVAAWVISQHPRLQKLVRGNSVPSPLDY